VNTAAASKNAAGGEFSNRVVNGTVERGRERILVPMGFVVSDLETTLVGLEVMMNKTYQKQLHSDCQ
jgi:hypothetical protein